MGLHHLLDWFNELSAGRPPGFSEPGGIAWAEMQAWQRLMGNLGKHFGVDASLDAATNRAIASWLKDRKSVV